MTMTEQLPPLLRQAARSSTLAPLALMGVGGAPEPVPGAVTVPGAATTRRR